jgi:hypothetical protein
VAVAELPVQEAEVVALVAFVAFVAFVALFEVDALPVIEIAHVPDAPLPVGLGTSDPITKPKFVLAADEDEAPVPPLATGTAFTRPSAASSRPLESRLFASCDKLNACVMLRPYAAPSLANVCWFNKVKLFGNAVTKL